MTLDTTLTQFQTIGSWRDFVEQTFLPLEIKIGDTAPFSYSAANTKIGDLVVSDLYTNATTVTRTSALVARSEKAIYKASLQLSGTSEIIQKNRRITLKPGQWALYDANQPYRVRVGDGSHFLVLQIEHDLLSIEQPYIEWALARGFDNTKGCGSLLLQLLTTALTQRSTLSGIAAEVVSNAILQLIAAQIIESLEVNAQADPSSLHQAELLKIQHYIQQHLHSFDLNVKKLCVVFNCSRRYLYNLFSSQGLTPADYIQRQRLESSCKHLSNPSYQRPISELAYQHGFKDAATFSHAFRRRYGASPTAWQQKQLHIGTRPS